MTVPDAFCDKKLLPLLTTGWIALLDSDWLLRYNETLLPRRQDLPAEAFLNSTAFQHGVSDVVALSHMWLSRGHPDPDGTTLAMVKRGIQLLLKSKKYGIFWDYASLYQKSLNQTSRNPHERKIFKEALNGIPYLYMHRNTDVFVVTQFPDTLPKGGRNLIPYKRRGWTFAEFSWAGLAEYGWQRKTYDLSVLGKPLDGKKASSEALEAAKQTRTGPMTPATFEAHAKDLHFTNGKRDRDIVTKIYKDAVISVLRRAEFLTYEQLGWTHFELNQLADIFLGGYAPIVDTLSLEGNDGIGNEGARHLATCIKHVKTINLDRIGLTDSGCKDLMDDISTDWLQQNRLNEISFSGNKIGDEGLAWLAPLLMRVRTEVELKNAGLSDLAVEILAQQARNSSVALIRLDLSSNHIRCSLVNFEDLFKHAPSLSWLNLKANSLEETCRNDIKRSASKWKVTLEFDETQNQGKELVQFTGSSTNTKWLGVEPAMQFALALLICFLLMKISVKRIAWVTNAPTRSGAPRAIPKTSDTEQDKSFHYKE